MSDFPAGRRPRVRPQAPAENPPERPERRQKNPYDLNPPARVEPPGQPLFAHMALPNLRHERFVQEIAIGTPKGEAYLRAGYDTETPAQGAANLLNQDDVRARLEYLRGRAADITGTTLADLVRELEDARLSAKSLGQPGAMVAATKEKAVLLGLRVEKRDTTTRAGDPKGMSDDELARIAKSGGDGAASPEGDTDGPQPVVH